MLSWRTTKCSPEIGSDAHAHPFSPIRSVSLRIQLNGRWVLYNRALMNTYALYLHIHDCHRSGIHRVACRSNKTVTNYYVARQPVGSPNANSGGCLSHCHGTKCLGFTYQTLIGSCTSHYTFTSTERPPWRSTAPYPCRDVRNAVQKILIIR